MGLSLGIGLGLGFARSRGGGYNPVNALGSDLLGYWDANDLSTITQSGGFVSSWRDKVGGYDAVQATGSAKPAYSAAGFNSAPTLVFDGVDDRLTMASIPFPTGAGQAEVWALVDQTALPADTGIRCFFAYGNSTTNADRRCRRNVPSGVNRANVLVGAGASSPSASGDTVDLSGRHLIRSVFGASQTSIHVDDAASFQVAAVPATAASGNVSIGALPNGGLQYWQGSIPLVIVTKPLSADKATALRNYLIGRRG